MSLRAEALKNYLQGMELLSHSELSRLSAPERLALISQLWDSLDDEEMPLSLAQREELDRRLADLEGDRDNLITWDAMKAELERRCP